MRAVAAIRHIPMVSGPTRMGMTDPQAEFRHMAGSLKIGGAFVFNQRLGEDAERPMHILTTAAPVLRAIRRSGLREAGEGAARDLPQLTWNRP